MAALPCKVIAQVAFKTSGDVFHRLVANNPHHFATVSPGKIHACDLHHGKHGTEGSVIEWKLTLDGKQHTLKQVIQSVDKSKKLVSHKMIGGDMMDVYKYMIITTHVETKGGLDFITWTIDYELLSPETPHPMSLLNFCIELTKDVEAHIFG